MLLNILMLFNVFWICYELVQQPLDCGHFQLGLYLDHRRKWQSGIITSLRSHSCLLPFFSRINSAVQVHQLIRHHPQRTTFTTHRLLQRRVFIERLPLRGSSPNTSLRSSRTSRPHSLTSGHSSSRRTSSHSTPFLSSLPPSTSSTTLSTSSSHPLSYSSPRPITTWSWSQLGLRLP